MKKLMDEYKIGYILQQDKNKLLEVELSEITNENEVALRRLQNAENELFKTKKVCQQLD